MKVCTTSFAWSTRAFGPTVGWLNGWAIFLADLLVTNGRSGGLTVLPGRGQGFFDDRDPRVIDLGPIGPPTVVGPRIVFPTPAGGLVAIAVEEGPAGSGPMKASSSPDSRLNETSTRAWTSRQRRRTRRRSAPANPGARSATR